MYEKFGSTGKEQAWVKAVTQLIFERVGTTGKDQVWV
jgi:hypothetical protein